MGQPYNCINFTDLCRLLNGFGNGRKLIPLISLSIFRVLIASPPCTYFHHFPNMSLRLSICKHGCKVKLDGGRYHGL